MAIKTKKNKYQTIKTIKDKRPTKKRNLVITLFKLHEKKNKLIDTIRGFNIKEETLNLVKAIPRELFIPEISIDKAYENKPMAILKEQTISQPSLICNMIDAIEIKPDDKILEIGTGLGYNASLMSLACKEVITVEIYKALYKYAKRINLKLRKNNFLRKNIKFVHGDGYKGYIKKAKYNKIMATCSLRGNKIPDTLIEQLEEEGILLIPIQDMNNTNNFNDILYKFRKINGKLEEDVNFEKLSVKFVKYENLGNNFKSTNI